MFNVRGRLGRTLTTATTSSRGRQSFAATRARRTASVRQRMPLGHTQLRWKRTSRTRMTGSTSDRLDQALSQIEKTFGDEALIRLGDHGGQSSGAEKPAVLSTGSIGLDIALGVGGLARGRITEVYGPESSGKTTLALHVIAEAQRQGGNATFVDAEHALDPIYAKRIGVNVDNLFVSQPESGEQALEITDTLVRSGSMDVIVVDSVAALVPQAELDGDMAQQSIGLQARLMSQALRKLGSSLATSPQTVLIFINQLRSKVNVMFGSPDVTSGGRSLAYYATSRIDVRKIAQLKQGDAVVGNRVRAKVTKQKLAPPYRSCEFEIDFGRGISQESEILDYGTEGGVIEKSGAWYSYNGEKLGQGRENVKKLLHENEELFAEIRDKVKEKLDPANLVSEEVLAPSAEETEETK